MRDADAPAPGAAVPTSRASHAGAGLHAGAPWHPVCIQADGDIAQVMRHVCESGTVVTLAADTGASVRTHLCGVDTDERRLVFQVAADDRALQRLLGSPDVHGTAQVEDMRLRFDLDHAMLVRVHRHALLQTAMPPAVFQYRRRAHTRVPAHWQAAHARLRHPSLPDMVLALRVIDLGAGGLALLLPRDVPPIEPGLLLHGVTLLLDANVALPVSLHLQHVAELHAAKGARRLGCAFHDLQPAVQHALQQHLERLRSLAPRQHVPRG